MYECFMYYLAIIYLFFIYMIYVYNIYRSHRPPPPQITNVQKKSDSHPMGLPKVDMFL